MQGDTNPAEARHHEVLGQPPRIPVLPREAVAEAVQATTRRLRGGVLPDAPPLPLEAIPEIMFAMAPYGDLWERIMDLTVQLQGAGSVLPPRDRKLAILRTGWLCQAPYEFGEHVNQAKALGFTAAEIAQIITGSTCPEWTAHERAILRAVEELHARCMVSDETWAVLAQSLDHAQLVELMALIGQFTATAYFQNALRFRLDPGNLGLMAR